VIEAAFWGGLGAAALLVGALVAFSLDVPKRTQGLILAFGAGTLIGAVAYELVEEAVAISVGGIDVAIGFGLGAIVFYLGSIGIDRMSPVRQEGMPSKRDPRTSGLALVLGAVLDGIPESIVLGLSLVGGEGISVAVLVAVLISNFPEGLSSSRCGFLLSSRARWRHQSATASSARWAPTSSCSSIRSRLAPSSQCSPNQ
jgi:ZIP family zinc transporter